MISSAHENQACPPALPHMGNIRLGTESDLVACSDLDQVEPEISLFIDFAWRILKIQDGRQPILHGSFTWTRREKETTCIIHTQ